MESPWQAGVVIDVKHNSHSTAHYMVFLNRGQAIDRNIGVFF